ncbi:hypothetical protein SAMN02745196_00059 [Clostridium collagenovorans DSM 3089]|uniref:Uncharacterized protein n=1 Tax=Clostridium collagenovorans DSM 3089 TaxID=1121306 RepID=A0A1M5S6Y9_9CLOT|nr:hypothetical protein [Clostridium collagenovorans]SHH34210.1 hypothetical protein SAMN02745196_00059 [Clostridium collagenovorans DSM 3089]
MKKYTIFAGVNGVGKTSIYKSIYYKENIDEKVARIGSWQDNNIQRKSKKVSFLFFKI